MIVFVNGVCLEDKFVVAMIMLVNLWPGLDWRGRESSQDIKHSQRI